MVATIGMVVGTGWSFIRTHPLVESSVMADDLLGTDYGRDPAGQRTFVVDAIGSVDEIATSFILIHLLGSSPSAMPIHSSSLVDGGNRQSRCG
jgi:hypothetical protein